MTYGPFIDDVIGTGRPLLIGVHPRLSAAQKSFNNFLNSRARQRSIIEKGMANPEREASAKIAPEFPVDAVAHRRFLNSRGILAPAIVAVPSTS